MRLTERKLRTIIREELNQLNEYNYISNYLTTTVGWDMTTGDRASEVYEAGLKLGEGDAELDDTGIRIIKNWSEEDNTNRYWKDFANGFVDGIRTRFRV